MDDNRTKAERFLALRSAGVLSPREESVQKKPRQRKKLQKVKLPKKQRELLPAAARKGAAKVFEQKDLRIVRTAAEAAGLAVEPVADERREFRMSRLMIDGALTEVRYVTKLAKKDRSFARSEFSRARVSGDVAHIVLIDIDGQPMRAYRFPSHYLHRRLFEGRDRTSADLYIPLDTEAFADHRLDWPLKRPRPAE